MLCSPEVIDLTLSSSSEASAAGASNSDTESEKLDILGTDWDGDEVMSLQSLPRAGSKRPRPHDNAADAAGRGPAAAAQGGGACGGSQRRSNVQQRTEPHAGRSAHVQQPERLAEWTDVCLLSDTGATGSSGQAAGHAKLDLETGVGRPGQLQQPVRLPAARPPRTKLTARKSTQTMARKSTYGQRWVDPSPDRRAPASASPSQPELLRSQSVAQAPLLKLCPEPALEDPATESSADAANSAQTVRRSPNQPPVVMSATGVLLETVLRQAAELAEVAVPQPVQPCIPLEFVQSASLPGHAPPCSVALQQGQQCDGDGTSAPPRRPPRAAAPKPGQLRDLIRIEQEILQQQHLQRRSRQAATAATKRRVGTQWPAKKRVKSHAAAAEAVEHDVALCEEDRRARSATFAAAAGA